MQKLFVNTEHFDETKDYWDNHKFWRFSCTTGICNARVCTVKLSTAFVSEQTLVTSIILIFIIAFIHDRGEWFEKRRPPGNNGQGQNRSRLLVVSILSSTNNHLVNRNWAWMWNWETSCQVKLWESRINSSKRNATSSFLLILIIGT